jgi:hypothetical protein
VLLLKELRKNTHPKDAEYNSINTALSKVEAIAAFVNENKRHFEHLSKMIDIQNRIAQEDFVVLKPHRRLICACLCLHLLPADR